MGPAKGPDQDQNRDRNTEQQQQDVTAHFRISESTNHPINCGSAKEFPRLLPQDRRHDGSCAAVIGTDLPHSRSAAEESIKRSAR
jgi:hypothetical protein